MKTSDGLWKLTPSGLYGYEDCPACFWLEQRVGRAPSIPMRLNDAMDEKMKHRYDAHRKAGMMPPEVASLKGIRLMPDLKTLDAWRTDYYALQVTDKKAGYTLYGKLDEVFVTDKGEYMPADFKSSGDVPKPDKQKYYRSQINAYAFMIKAKGFPVADHGYLIHYYTKDRTDGSLVMEFATMLDRVEVNLDAFEKKLQEMVNFLNTPLEKINPDCKKCSYHKARAQLL